MSAFAASTTTTGLLYVDHSTGQLVSSGKRSAAASPGANASLRSTVDQLRVSEIHVGNASKIEIADTGGTAVATFNADGSHRFGAAAKVVTFDGDVTVVGDLTVQGTTTTVSTTNLVVADSLIGLSNGLAGAEANDAGLVVERGSSGNDAAMVWDKSAAAWHAATTTGNAASTGDLTLADAAFLCGAITTTGAFSQTGTGTFSTGTGQVTANGNLDAISGLDVTGAALTIGTGGSFSQTVGGFTYNAASGAVAVDAQSFSIDATAASNLSVTASTLTVSTITSGLLSVTGASGVTITSTGGTLTANASGQSFNVTATTLALTGAMTVSTTLAVTGNATFTADILANADNTTTIGSATNRMKDVFVYGRVVHRAVAANAATPPIAGDAVVVDSGGNLAQSDATAAATSYAVGVYGGAAGLFAGSGSTVTANKRPTTGGGTPTAWESLTAGDVVYLTSSDFAYSDETPTAPTAAVKKGTVSKALSTTSGDVVAQIGIVVANSGTGSGTATIVVLPRYQSTNA